MKFYKIILMIMGVAGLIASLMNTFYFENPSKSNNLGFLGAVFLIWFAIYLDKYIKRFPGKKKVFLPEDEINKPNKLKI